MEKTFGQSIFILRSKSFVIVTVFLLSVFAMMPQIQSISDLLWAEDGIIFATEAFSLGWKSITTPYAGYLHFFPRMIALISTVFGIDLLPIVFLVGWFLAVGYALIVIFRSLTSRNFKATTAAFVCISIFILPSSGEVYFNLTNSQWFLGLGLCVYFIIPINPIFNWRFDVFFLPFVALTGPFCVIVLPFAALKIIMVSKNFHLWNWRLSILFIGAIVQVVYFLSSSRTGGMLDLNALHWLSALDIFLTFGIMKFGFGFSVIIWTVVAYFVRDLCTKNSDARATGFILLALAFTFFAVSLWSTKGAPTALHPMFGGARYYFVPYSLILLSWMFLLERGGRLPKMVLAVLISVGLLHGIGQKTHFTAFGPPRNAKVPIDYTAFVQLNRAGEMVDIQLNPFWNMYPSPWRIKATIPRDLNSRPYRIFLTPQDVIQVYGRFDVSKGFAIDESSNDPYLVFSVPSKCGAYDYIAVTAELKKETEGQVELFWQTQSHAYFTPQQSRRRFSPKGDSIVHFALQNRGVSAIRLDPAMDASKSLLKSVEVICYD